METDEDESVKRNFETTVNNDAVDIKREAELEPTRLGDSCESVPEPEPEPAQPESQTAQFTAQDVVRSEEVDSDLRIAEGSGEELLKLEEVVAAAGESTVAEESGDRDSIRENPAIELAAGSLEVDGEGNGGDALSGREMETQREDFAVEVNEVHDDVEEEQVCDSAEDAEKAAKLEVAEIAVPKAETAANLCEKQGSFVLLDGDVAEGTGEKMVSVKGDEEKDENVTYVDEEIAKIEDPNEENDVSEVAEGMKVDCLSGELKLEETGLAEGMETVNETHDEAEEMQLGGAETSVCKAGEEVAVIEDKEMTNVVESVNDEEEPEEKEIVTEMETADVPEEDDQVRESKTEMDEAAEEIGEKADTEEIGVKADTEETEMMESEMADVGEDTEIAVEETEAAEEAEAEEANRSASGKRKRGKSSKASVRTPVKKKVEEDVCFLCYDGGNLVLCDRRGCPKAYHPVCVERDEAFFRTKGKWYCAWHICNSCEKNAHYMCYTCTFSSCKSCIKDQVILCVRDNKGFCEKCMKTVKSIESNEPSSEMARAEFDKSSSEYLFKEYWIDLKGQLSLTSEELTQAKNPWKGSELHADKQESSGGNKDEASESDGSDGTAEAPVRKRRKAPKRGSRSRTSRRSARTGSEGSSDDESAGWASKELLEFVMHMKNGNKSALSQFDVQALLLEYIKTNKLRDPRRKSQIICDSRLQNLFGKPRVGHFEMLKLLELHFLTNDKSPTDDLQGNNASTEGKQSETDGASDVLTKASKDKKRKVRKKGEERLQSNLEDYAAIDKHNINLVYLRRNLVEDLLEDSETFHDKVVGTFVRIRISGSAQKQDMYRLVQVVGTSKAAEPYKVGKKTTDYMLEILNLNKTEVVSIDIISNQDFTEDECKRLRQSIKCGLINRLTVGDIQEKALGLQTVRVKDWLESETNRLTHLRDRASDLGKRKELRECVEKLELLQSREERQRRLEEIPEIHADPNMDPSYVSDEDDGTADDKRHENNMRPRGSGFNRRGRDSISPRKGGFASNDSWAGTKSYSGVNSEFSRKMPNKGFLNNNKGDDGGAGEAVNGNLWNQGREKDIQQSSTLHSAVTSQSSSKSAPEVSAGPAAAKNSAPQINESEKIWHYKDPSGKIQGPFSMTQLHKWNNTGYFPADLRIWRAGENQDHSMLLTDALAGKFHKDPPLTNNIAANAKVAQGMSGASGQSLGESWKPQPGVSSLGKPALSSIEVPKISSDRWGSDTNLPSPTPNQGTARGMTGQAFENQWSPTPVQPGSSNNPLSGGNRVLQPAPTPNVSHEKSPFSAHQLPASVATGAGINLGVDVKNVGAILKNLVQATSSLNPPVESQAWGSGSTSKSDMMTPSQLPSGGSQAWGNAPPQKLEHNNSNSMPVQSTYSQWGNAPASVHHPNSGWNGGTAGGAFPAQVSSGLPQSDPWRPQAPPQSITQPLTQSNMPWGMNVSDNQGATLRQGWGAPAPANAHSGWGTPGQGSVQGNTIPSFVPQSQPQMPGNSNPGWASQAQGQGPRNAIQNWAPSGQGPSPVNASPGWSPTGPGPAPGNTGQGWGPTTGKQNMWGNEQNGDRYSGPRDRDRDRERDRDRGSSGGDSSYGGSGGKPWSRQSSFGSGGGGSSRTPFKGQRVCKYHESGHCKKGSACDYLHS